MQLIILVLLVITQTGSGFSYKEQWHENYCNCLERAYENLINDWPNGKTPKQCFDLVLGGRQKPTKEQVKECQDKKDDVQQDLSCLNIMLYHMGELYLEDIERFGSISGKSFEVVRRMAMSWEWYSIFFKGQPFFRSVCPNRAALEFPEFMEMISQINFLDKSEDSDSELSLNRARITVESYDKPNLLALIEEVCSQKPNDNYCLKMRAMARILKRVKKLIGKVMEKSIEDPYVMELHNATMLNFVPMILLNEREFSGVEPKHSHRRNLLFNKFTNKVFDLTYERKFGELDELMTFLPNVDDITGCDRFGSNTWCMFRSVLDQIKQYLKYTKRATRLSKRMNKVIITAIDYKGLLKYRQLEQILETLQGQTFTLTTTANYLKQEFNKSLGERFQELKTYFMKVQSFAQEKLNADIGYVEGMLKHYKESLKELSDELIPEVEGILSRSKHAAVAERAEKAAKLAVHVIEACNPFNAVFAGGTATPILDATAELSKAIANLIKVGTIKEDFEKLMKMSNEIGEKFGENHHFLTQTAKLVPSVASKLTKGEFENAKTQFLEMYTAYSPTVTAPEITEIGEMWNTVVDEACKIIEGSSGAVSSAIESESQYNGNCWKTKIKIAKMIETYVEIYEFQFEWIETLANYMRAKTGLEAAEDISDDFERISKENIEDASSLEFLTNLASMTYITHQIQTWEIVEAYCDVLEYQEAGRRPSMCKGQLTDVPTLMARIPKPCDSDIVQFVDIPIKKIDDTDKSDQLSSVNVIELFRGNSVTFKVPDNNWLVEWGWILPQDKESVIYVKRFELYLPTVNYEPKSVKSIVRPLGENKLYSNKGDNYTLIPAKEFIFEYEEGVGSLNCRGSMLRNPYTTCRQRRLPYICKLSTEDFSNDYQTSVEYPSLYARWELTVKGYESLAVPIAETDITLKAAVQLCKIRRDRASNMESGTSSTESAQADGGSSPAGGKSHIKIIHNETDKRDRWRRGAQPWGCCNGNRYFDTGKDKCKRCPSDSSVQLNGYYCEKNE